MFSFNSISKSLWLSLSFIIFYNLINILFLLFGTISVFDILLIYVFEGFVILIFCVIKYLVSKDKTVRNTTGIIFYFMLFGIFYSVYVVFLLNFFSSKYDFIVLILPLILLIGRYLFSLCYNYIKTNESNSFDLKYYKNILQKRVIIMHFIIIVGLIIYFKYNSSIYLFLIFVIIKLIIDIYYHLREHYNSTN